MKPRLINPVQVTVERLDKAGTTWDTTFREAAANTAIVYHPAEMITAQTKINSFELRRMVPAGDSPSTSGYILYERANTPSLKKGDKVTEIGGIQLEIPLFVKSIEPAVQHGGRFYMELAHLEERAKGL